MATIDSQIISVSEAISENINRLRDNRQLLAQNILSQLRNLVEAVAVRLHRRTGTEEFAYALVGPAVDYVGSGKKQINFIYRFHKLLKMSVSHYTFDGDASERLMLKYYEHLHRTRALVFDLFGLRILENLEDFPVDLDPSLQEYHRRIAERIDAFELLPGNLGIRNRYYIHKVRPFFTGGRIFYEVTFSSAINHTTKFDRMIGFTDIDMTDKYAAHLSLAADSIEVLDHVMPITLIRSWEVSIRPCEFNNFAKLFGMPSAVSATSSEYKALMLMLTETHGSLLDLMETSDVRYAQLRHHLTQNVSKAVIFPVLDAARRIIQRRLPGSNLLRYLLLSMNNRIVKSQFHPNPCTFLSDLRLSAGCKPFDDMPFCTSPVAHNPRFSDLVSCIETSGRKHELLARRVKNNVERHGLLYTPIPDVEDLGDVRQLVDEYNRRVYSKHQHRQLVLDMGHVFMREYEDGTVAIIQKLREYALAGIGGHEGAVERWLENTPLSIDDDAKRSALRALFTKSRVALIYGAAGTGKSTMVNYIANYFSDRKKLLLAHTNPAIDNLKRKVSAQNTDYRTISSHNARGGSQTDYDVLIVDECSTVSNTEFLKVLQNTSFKLLVLVGDVFQIESIQFGNWFAIMRAFLPAEAVFELTKPYRTDSPALLEFWSKVRHLEEGIEEVMAHNGYSAALGEALLQASYDDEIVLCLNYDGLYGINNVNRFLQSGNPSSPILWDVTVYKVGDPVLFNDTERFRPLIYNNLKGRIMDVAHLGDRIRFNIELDRGVTALDVDGRDLRYVDGSTVSFDVFAPQTSDEDDDSGNRIVPFQVAYAVSIHKAQGLEYKSVKIVITETNEDDISHNIFYTAITRSREHLKIFWTPETQLAILSSLERKRSDRDVALLRQRRGV